jgi:hypothetical protein
LQLRTLAGEREAYCTNCGEANSLGTPRSAFRKKPWRVAGHEGAKRNIGQAFASTPGTQVRLEAPGYQTPDWSTQRNPGHHIAWVPDHGLANSENDPTVVSLASKDSRITSLAEEDNNPCRQIN